MGNMSYHEGEKDEDGVMIPATSVESVMSGSSSTVSGIAFTGEGEGQGAMGLGDSIVEGGEGEGDGSTAMQVVGDGIEGEEVGQ